MRPQVAIRTWVVSLDEASLEDRSRLKSEVKMNGRGGRGVDRKGQRLYVGASAFGKRLITTTHLDHASSGSPGISHHLECTLRKSVIFCHQIHFLLTVQKGVWDSPPLLLVGPYSLQHEVQPACTQLRPA
jgi:hypothetical protein